MAFILLIISIIISTFHYPNYSFECSTSTSTYLRSGRPEVERAVGCEREAAIAAVGAVHREPVEQLVHRVERHCKHASELLARKRALVLSGAIRALDARVVALNATVKRQ